MLGRLVKYAFIVLIVMSGAYVAAGERALEPAPQDRPNVDYERLEVKHKRDKWGMIVPGPDAISLKFLPKDRYGFVDWTKAVREGSIAPKDTLMGVAEEKGASFDADIIIKSKLDFMPDVLFPHSVHNDWLKCSVCHPKIFLARAGATPISMIGIWKGKFCGRCHDKVAFPIRNCFKCHSVQKKAPQ
ncbi:MAG: hypothetical protein BMS9Abin23_0990 [Thermodesulfobacteriota bacterium]|nr:MAG: hypothetical protein BMS9Abin23_0990 [Thermodesulfobacteriota bacterium]